MRPRPISFAAYRHLVLAGLLGLLLPAAPASAGLEAVALSAGGFDVVDGDREAVEAGIELAWRPRALRLFGRTLSVIPVIGAMATEDSSAYGYGGWRLDLPLGERFVATPQLAAGFYERGDGKELGGSVQFRSGIELAWRASPRHRLGLLLYHLSNAGLRSSNPGSESVVLTWRMAW